MAETQKVFCVTSTLYGRISETVLYVTSTLCGRNSESVLCVTSTFVWQELRKCSLCHFNVCVAGAQKVFSVSVQNLCSGSSESVLYVTSTFV